MSDDKDKNLNKEEIEAKGKSEVKVENVEVVEVEELPTKKKNGSGKKVKKSKAAKKPAHKGVLTIVKEIIEADPTKLYTLDELEMKCNGQKKSTFEIQVNKLCQTDPEFKKLTVGSGKFIGSSGTVENVQKKIQTIVDEFSGKKEA